MSFITKLILYEESNWLLAGGLGVSVPTADDMLFRVGNAAPVLEVSNDAVHLTPYLAAAYYSPTSSCFANAFLTVDVDANGNPTSADEGTGFERIGTWNAQNLISFDLAVGSWLYESSSRRDRLQGIAWSAELHYTATANDADVVESNFFLFGNPTSDISLLNAVVGGHVRLGKTTFTVGYATPLTSSDRVFDGELRAFVNREF